MSSKSANRTSLQQSLYALLKGKPLTVKVGAGKGKARVEVVVEVPLYDFPESAFAYPLVHGVKKALRDVLAGFDVTEGDNPQDDAVALVTERLGKMMRGEMPIPGLDVADPEVREITVWLRSEGIAIPRSVRTRQALGLWFQKEYKGEGNYSLKQLVNVGEALVKSKAAAIKRALK